jgi:hypothetical protein
MACKPTNVRPKERSKTSRLTTNPRPRSDAHRPPEQADVGENLVKRVGFEVDSRR